MDDSGSDPLAELAKQKEREWRAAEESRVVRELAAFVVLYQYCWKETLQLFCIFNESEVVHGLGLRSYFPLGEAPLCCHQTRGLPSR